MIPKRQKIEGKQFGAQQGLADCFYKGPDSEYFLLCEAIASLSLLLKCPCGVKAALDNTETDGQGWICHPSLPAGVCQP